MNLRPRHPRPADTGARRGRTRIAVASVVLALTGAAAVPAFAAQGYQPCPAKEIRKVWDGGQSTKCPDMGDRLDHLFYPGYASTTALAHRYRENTVFIQLRLRDLNYAPLVIDGYYGNQTAGAVTRYQRNHHLIVDGVVGAQTWKALFGLGPS